MKKSIHDSINKNDRRRCRMCGTCCLVYTKHYFMLKDNLWKKICPKEFQKDMLCMDCVEKKLGRKIQLKDLNDSPLNVEINPYTKPFFKD